MKNETTLHLKHILVIGANGGVGKHAVEQALQQGHVVTAMVRNPSLFKLNHTNLRVVTGDVLHPETYENHVADKDAIIFAVGITGFKPTDLYSRGAKNLMQVMAKTTARRAYFISASGLSVNPTHSLIVRLATKFILQKLLKNMYADLERMESYIRSSALDWTIMRPPRLTNKPVAGRYRFAVNELVDNGLTISRADLAHFMLANISNEAIFRTTVEIADEP